MANPSTSTLKVLAAAVILVGLVAGTTLSKANPSGNSALGRSFSATTSTSRGGARSYGGYGGYGGYGYGYGGGYYSTYRGGATYAPGNSGSTHWWVGPNGNNAELGVGYNPNSGYDWDSVCTLLLETNPPKARVTIDGTYVGTMDSLGPFQLPVGNHTLKIEAAGFEPSETVLKVEEPALRQLEVKLTPISHGNKPAPAK